MVNNPRPPYIPEGKTFTYYQNQFSAIIPDNVVQTGINDSDECIIPDDSVIYEIKEDPIDKILSGNNQDRPRQKSIQRKNTGTEQQKI